MKRKIACLLVLLLTVFSLAGCAAKTTEKNQNSAGESKKLFTLRVPTQTTFNETDIADELGYFREEGIEIKYTGVVKPGTDIQTVASGDNDAFISGHPNNVAQARLAGVKVLAVAPGMVDNPDFPHVRYLVKEDSPIKSLKDIVGKKVSISSYGVCSDGYLKLWLKQNNLPQNVEWVVLPTAGQQEQSLKQGLIDVTTSHPPYAGVALSDGGVRQIATSYDIVKTPAAGLSVRGFSEQFIKEHPDVVRGFCRALAKVHPWINAHHKEAIEIIAKRLNLPAEKVNQSVFWYDEHKAIEPSYIETWFKISQDIGLWKEGDIKPTDIYTNEFAPQ